MTYESEQKQSSVGEYSMARKRLNADIFSSEHDYQASSLRHQGSQAGSQPYTFHNSQQRLREEQHDNQPGSQPSISFRSEDQEQQAAPPGRPAPLAFTTQQTDPPGRRHQDGQDTDAPT